MILRPDGRFLFSHPAHFVALGFGAGLAPAVPGTFGTLVGFPLYYGLSALLPESWELLAVAAALFALGIWACARTGDALGVPDHGAMVWDEVVAFLAILVFTPPGPGWQAFAFVTFRVFDVLKPPPIRWFDRHWKGGFGVMFDDLLAALYSVLVIAIAKAAVG